ncbi:MAG: FMN-binding negative transcriptional regulator [Flavobacteriales bacterium]
MYIPHYFEMTDRPEIISFMRRFNFAVIVTSKDNTPIASHLPFVISERGDEILLRAHFAKANPQWKEIESASSLVVFSEPHAYISPQQYDAVQSVPTWNYLAVHASGKAKIISEMEEVIAMLEEAIDTYEPDYRAQWNHLPKDYKKSMIKGIVAFEILVTQLEGKKKLSQNKTESERIRIAENLSQSEDTVTREIGWRMTP